MQFMYRVLGPLLVLAACAEPAVTNEGGCAERECPRGTQCRVLEAGETECTPDSPVGQPPTDAMVLPVIDAAPGDERDEGTRLPDITNPGGGAGGEPGGQGGQDGQGGAMMMGGQVGAGGVTGGGACGDVRLLLKPSAGSVARVMLVVDRSYSMIEDFQENRWVPVAETLTAVTADLEDVLQFGLVLFPDPYPPADVGPPVRESCAPGRVNVSVGPRNAQNIANWFADDGAGPDFNQGTPMASALQAAGEALMENPTGNDYILLATDGGPGCNFGLDHTRCPCLTGGTCVVWERPQNCLDDARTVEVVETLARSGISTFVLGIVDDGFTDDVRPLVHQTLNRMAVAGGTAVDGRHFEIGSLPELRRQLAATAGGLVPCVYDLEQLVDHVERINVSIDGMPVARDPVNGWDFVDGQLVLNGRACTSLRDGRAHEVLADCQ